MVNINVIRELFEGVVNAYKEDLTWYSRWSPVLDDDTSKAMPAVSWVEPRVELVQVDQTIVQQFTVNILIEDSAASDRAPLVRDHTYERMQIVAAHIWARFRELYFLEESVYQNVNVSLSQRSAAVFTAVWDTAGQHTTGCALTVTIESPYQFCASDYFNV